MAPRPGQAVHGAGEDGQGPVTPAHTPEPPHIPGRGPGTRTVLDTTCSSSRAGPAAVFSRRCCRAGTPPCPARNVRQEHSVSELSRPSLYNSPSIPLPIPREHGVTQAGLIPAQQREQTPGQERKHCPDPPPNITQAGLGTRAARPVLHMGYPWGCLAHLLFH